MNIEHHFLIKYGLHNFVSSYRTGRKRVFLIGNREGLKMVKHAKYLIEESFGESAEICVI